MRVPYRYSTICVHDCCSTVPRASRVGDTTTTVVLPDLSYFSASQSRTPYFTRPRFYAYLMRGGKGFSSLLRRSPASGPPRTARRCLTRPPFPRGWSGCACVRLLNVPAHWVSLCRLGQRHAHGKDVSFARQHGGRNTDWGFGLRFIVDLLFFHF